MCSHIQALLCAFNNNQKKKEKKILISSSLKAFEVSVIIPIFDDVTQGSRTQKVSLMHLLIYRFKSKRFFVNSQTIVSPDVAYSSTYLLFQLLAVLATIKRKKAILMLGVFHLYSERWMGSSKGTILKPENDLSWGNFRHHPCIF